MHPGGELRQAPDLRFGHRRELHPEPQTEFLRNSIRRPQLNPYAVWAGGVVFYAFGSLRIDPRLRYERRVDVLRDRFEDLKAAPDS